MTRNISHGKEPRVDESTTQAYGTGDPRELRAQPGRADDDLVDESEKEEVQQEADDIEASADEAKDEDEAENLVDVGGP